MLASAMRLAQASSSGLSFGTWLLRQGERRDDVGSLARAAGRDHRFATTDRPKALRSRLLRLDADTRTIRAVRIAEREWARAARGSSGLGDKREADPRKALAQHATRGKHELAELSRMLGHGDGYLGRFVREGVPAALSARDHRFLAVFFGVDERGLGVRELWADA